ncbi:MAG TPA: MEDS domain-containing protein [Solirubrobacterales bacterium]|nr:MEDS domain-containing protein [Solirubrobacterales bacterium]
MEQIGFQHEALIYEGSEQYLEGTLPFISGALDAGEPVLVAVGAAQTELLVDALAEDANRVRFLDMAEAGRNPAQIISLWREFVTGAGGRSARGIGEPVWADRSAAALDECQRHESLLNVAFAPALSRPRAWP